MNLKDYLTQKDESISSFAKRTLISALTAAKAYHGKPIRIDIAKRIVRATKGKVTFEDLGLINRYTQKNSSCYKTDQEDVKCC